MEAEKNAIRTNYVKARTDKTQEVRNNKRDRQRKREREKKRERKKDETVNHIISECNKVAEEEEEEEDKVGHN